ncbi:SMI1/KNR4 family protein [Paenibacillus chitinolyticus]|uniref:SMI1/KNR4 family protein n=1 Tax=Paenibacillus chitinolyticus TaxID=79263 RepID=A0A410WVQ8_9BACL|nr:SMI1/KNR4 family protein [Paenibacillus chitinolyticus]MCY9589169.1 SMI1/KNR4 family protein [Paenibacillus chitinolyticus]MCY9594242.1 SMI1/KNR4 family protein [Paenibacillus chitinolyticus]QAV18498.1 SMI1/KNR4 family protein [Paenibacillus chitinolyticus]
MKNHAWKKIEQYYGIVFPSDYLNFLQKVEQHGYNFVENGDVTDWEIRFSELDERFIETNRSLVDEVNPDPKRLIPFAWSVSSGNNYLFDYRTNLSCPAVVLMDHEEAMVREDAESESETLEEAQELMEQNVRKAADNFAEFAARLQPYTAE